MSDLTPALLAHACRIFLRLAYPGGEDAVPPAKRPYRDLTPEQSLEPLLTPPIHQTLRDDNGSLRGHTFRLGSERYPHLKLQVTRQDDVLVFSVDTHDQILVPPDRPDALRLATLQETNRQLKQQIERAWEAEGLVTFNTLLRQELGE